MSFQFLLRTPSHAAGKAVTAASPQGTAIATHPGAIQPQPPRAHPVQTVTMATAPSGLFLGAGKGAVDEIQLPKLLIPSHRIKAEVFEPVS